MERGEQAPADGLVASLKAASHKIDNSPELTRRGLLGGMFALSALAVAQRLGIEAINNRLERLALQADGCAEEGEVVQCYLQRDGITNVPAAGASETEAIALAPIPEETTTTLPPATATTAPPPPPPVEAPPPPELETAPIRNMPYGEFAANAELFLSKIPTLEQLQARFPGTAFFNFIPEQLQHIEYLNQTVQLTPDEFHQFGFSTEYSGVFPGARSNLDPKMVIWHWTGAHHDDPASLANAMTARKSSVQMYVHNNNVVYQMAQSLDYIMGHALKLNPISWGIEVYSGTYDEVHSPTFNYTPGTVKAGIYAGVNRLRSRGLPVNAATFMSHYAADLIFMNPYYDPYTGTFHEVPGFKPPSLHKFDPPQEFMNMIVAKAVALNQQLG